MAAPLPVAFACSPFVPPIFRLPYAGEVVRTRCGTLNLAAAQELRGVDDPGQIFTAHPGPAHIGDG